jgi:hypothetical protein
MIKRNILKIQNIKNIIKLWEISFEGCFWNTDFAVKRYQYYYALDSNSQDTKQALRQSNAVAKENAAKKAEDDWQKNKWKYMAIGAGILAATIAIPVAGAAIGEAAGAALLGTVLGEAAADTTLTVGAFDSGITGATAATLLRPQRPIGVARGLRATAGRYGPPATRAPTTADRRP